MMTGRSRNEQETKDVQEKKDIDFHEDICGGRGRVRWASVAVLALLVLLLVFLLGSTLKPSQSRPTPAPPATPPRSSRHPSYAYRPPDALRGDREDRGPNPAETHLSSIYDQPHTDPSAQDSINHVVQPVENHVDVNPTDNTNNRAETTMVNLFPKVIDNGHIRTDTSPQEEVSTDHPNQVNHPDISPTENPKNLANNNPRSVNAGNKDKSTENPNNETHSDSENSNNHLDVNVMDLAFKDSQHIIDGETSQKNTTIGSYAKGGFRDNDAATSTDVLYVFASDISRSQQGPACVNAYRSASNIVVNYGASTSRTNVGKGAPTVEEVATSFCSVEFDEAQDTCIVTCRNIVDYPPGLIATTFLTTMDCHGTTIHIIFECCYFPERKLEKGWFVIEDYRLQSFVKILSIRFATLDYIGDDAFEGIKHLKRLEITGGDLQELRKAMFRSFNPSSRDSEAEKLKPLLLELDLNRQNRVIMIEEGLLEDIRTLSSFQMQETINIENLLPNITASEIMSVQIIDLRYNIHLNTLRSSYFRGMKNVRSLYLQRSCVSKIESNTFENMEYLQALYLDQNDLETLPEGVIPNRFFKRSDFKVYLAGNKWHCDCSLAWLGNKIQNYPFHFGDTPQCYSPSHLKEIPLRSVNFSFCYDLDTSTTENSATQDLSTADHTMMTTDEDNIEITSSTQTETVHETTLPPTITQTATDDQIATQDTTEASLQSTPSIFTTTTDAPGNILKCKEPDIKLAVYPRQSKQYKRDAHYNTNSQLTSNLYPPIIHNFTISENNGVLEIYLDNEEIDSNLWTLMWMSDNDCYKLSMTNPVQIYDLEEGETYVLCLLYGQYFVASPFNCKAIQMQVSYEKQAWIANESKMFVIGSASGAIVVTGLIFMAITYILLGFYPELLKRNKRVVIVNHKIAKALILPRGYQPPSSPHIKGKNKLSPTSSCSNSAAHITPRSSTTTYVSVNEPTEEDLWDWRIRTMIEKQAIRETKRKKMEKETISMTSSERPPTPPRVMSISWNLNSSEPSPPSSA